MRFVCMYTTHVYVCLFLQENRLRIFFLLLFYFGIISVHAYGNPCLHTTCLGLFNMSLAHDEF